MCGFIHVAQLVEHRTGIAEVTGSNPVEALIFFFFFRLLYSNCLNWKFTAKITYHLHIYPQFTYESFHIHYIKENIIRNISRTSLFQQLLANKHPRLRDSVPIVIWPRGGLGLVTDKKTKKKSCAEQEPRSAHGRAVKKSFRINHSHTCPERGSRLRP